MSLLPIKKCDFEPYDSSVEKIAIRGSKAFCDCQVSALTVLFDSTSAKPYVDEMPALICQRTVFSCLFPRSQKQLVVSAESIRLEREYAACHLLFLSVVHSRKSMGKDDISIARRALTAQLDLAKELELDDEYLDFMKVNLSVLEVGVFPQAMLNHPAY